MDPQKEDAEPPSSGGNGIVPTVEVFTNLPLAIVLHFNAYFSLIFLFLELILTHTKLKRFVFRSTIQQKILLPSLLIWSVAEVARIYLGKVGNFYEKTPHLAGFILVTIFPQIPLSIYIGFFQEHVFPVDKALGGLMLTALGVGFIFGLQSLRSLTRRQMQLLLRKISEENKNSATTRGTKELS